MLRTVLVDDVRDIQTTELCRTYAEAFETLCQKKFDVMYLDHDLGCFDPKSGLDLNGATLIKVLSEGHVELPKIIVLVSGNPIGSERQRLILKDLGYKQIKEYKNDDIHLAGLTIMIFDEECQGCQYVDTEQCNIASKYRYIKEQTGPCPYKEVL